MKLISTMDVKATAQYTARQLNLFFPDENFVDAAALEAGVASTFDRLARLHATTADKYYFRDGQPFFDHLHGDQYATYIYFLSRYAVLEQGDRSLASKLYLLNKTLFSVDIFYEVVLPNIFLLCHPVGTVLGRATYEDFLVVTQGCTVGNIANVYPKLGRGVVLSAGSTVLGNCEIGDSACVGAGSLLVDLHVPPGCTAVGRAKDVRILPGTEAKWKNFYNPLAAEG